MLAKNQSLFTILISCCLLLLLSLNDALAQSLDAQADFSSASLLCHKGKINITNLNGPGTDNLEADGSCRQNLPESNTAWFRWLGGAGTNGGLTFTLIPDNPGDQLSFVLFRIGDNGTDKVVLRCALPCFSGPVGLAEGDFDLAIADCSTATDGFMEPLGMEEGVFYALMVENSSSNGGFSIEFGGSAVLDGPIADIVPDATNACLGNSITFNNNSTYENGNITGYEWGFEDGTQSLMTNESVTYDYSTVGSKDVLLTIKTAVGCNAMIPFNDIVTINSCCNSDNKVSIENPSFTDIDCPGDTNGIIDITISSSFPIESFWDDGIDRNIDSPSPTVYNTSASGLTAGTYSVTITNQANCKDSLTHTFVSPSTLELRDSFVNPNCQQSNGQIFLFATGGSQPYSYDFGDGNFIAASNLNGLDTGDYDVRVMDASGCTTPILPVELDEKELNIVLGPTTDPTCSDKTDGTVVINVDNGTGTLEYDFNDGNGRVDAAALKNLDEGSYTIDVFDAEGCTGSPVDFTLTKPAQLNVIVESRRSTCNGADDGTAIATPSGGTPDYSYLWSNNATTRSLGELMPGSYTVTVTDANGCTIERTSAELIDPPVLTASVVNTQDVSCSDRADGSIDLNIVGGTMPYRHSTDGITFDPGATIMDLTVGQYDIFVLDNNNCPAIAEATINSPANLSFDFDTNADICYGETVTFTNTSSFSQGNIASISWNFGDTTASGANPSVSFTTIGSPMITLTVASDLNCTEMIQQALPISVQPCCESDNGISSLALSESPLCDGASNGSIALNLSSIPPITEIVWTDNNTQEIRTDLAEGDYSVTVKNDATCEETYSFTLDDPEPVTAILTPTNPSCGGMADGIITANGFGGSNNGFEFDFGNGVGFTDQNVIDNLVANTYTVVVRDEFNCMSEPMDITLSELVLVPSTPLVTRPSCFGDSDGIIAFNVPNGNGPFMYDFNDGNDFQAAAALTGLSEGDYTIQIQDADLCLSEPVMVTIDQPDPLAINLIPTNISCFGENDGRIVAEVTGGVGNYNYTWSDGQTTNIAGNLPPDMYSVAVTDGNDCPIDSDMETIIEPAELSAAIGNIDDVLCFGEMNGAITVNAEGGSAPFEYSLDGIIFQPASTIQGLPAGDYTVIVRDNRDCEIETPTAMVDQPAEFTVDALTDNEVAKLGFSITLSAEPNINNSDINYIWTTQDSVVCNGCKNFETVPPGSTTYTLFATNGDNCQATSSVDIRVSLDRPVYIPNIFSPNGDGFNDEFFIPFSPAMRSIEELRIFDRFGTLVFEAFDITREEAFSKAWDGEFNGSKFRQGVFVVAAQIHFVDNQILPYQADLTLITSE